MRKHVRQFHQEKDVVVRVRAAQRGWLACA
jgi:hypothetical protein